ncbi:MAG: deoxyguanosinetriphosphate triphosphohydrolase [Spirochaetes bacterium]|nr:deoxyguanosinetriphosphate triphosphohydrolase [Spirochaetota bacterium]
MNIREMLESRERETLSPYAARAVESRGTLTPRTEDELRTVYMHDRDRIIHSEYFRRLKDKTQVIISTSGAYRTRLTHTLEVTQLARTIARALRLNEDLTEAIALAHDLGHTPFGHAGEKAINRLVGGGFHHSTHSLRVVDVLEKGKGLNLTLEVRDGILHHTKGKGRMIDDRVKPMTLESSIVRICDSIAYINHDIDDAIRFGILPPEEIPAECRRVLGDSYSERINTMVLAVIEASIDKPHISMHARVLDTTETLRAFMFERVYESPPLLREIEDVFHVIEDVYNYFHRHPDLLPARFKAQRPEDVGQHIIDFIAFQTDSDIAVLHRKVTAAYSDISQGELGLSE